MHTMRHVPEQNLVFAKCRCKNHTAEQFIFFQFSDKQRKEMAQNTIDKDVSYHSQASTAMESLGNEELMREM